MITILFKDTLKDRFIGQDSIVNQLDILGREIKSGSNFNILLAAQSGFGKTKLASLYLKWITNGMAHKEVFMYNGDVTKLSTRRRFHVFDEAHMIGSPEFLYPLMDSGELTFLVLTNEYFSLKEPFYNRCHEFIFSDYSEEDLNLMCIREFKERRIDIPRWISESVVKSLGRGVPRTIGLISERLAYYFNQSVIPSSQKELNAIFEYLLDVKYGLSNMDRQYLVYLDKSGGSASLSLLSSGSKIPRPVLLNLIEPYLVHRGLVEITSKGRNLNYTKLEELKRG